MSDVLEGMNAKIAKLDEEATALRAEMRPMTEQIKEHRRKMDALETMCHPFNERLRAISDERYRHERTISWLSQSSEIGRAWAAYVAGECDTILLARPEGVENTPVRPTRHVGAWAVHPTTGIDLDDGPIDRLDYGWTVTHGPSGLSAHRGRSEIDALALAVKLSEIAPDLDPQGRPVGPPALVEAVKAHRGARL
jgi:hypothetical protein